jgi:hypothetical protein
MNRPTKHGLIQTAGHRTSFVNVTVLVVSTLLSLVCIELALRSLVKPSERGFGRIAGRDLPPIAVMPKAVTQVARSSPGALMPEHIGPTGRDLRGFFEPHPVIGYIAAANRTSEHGFWQSNSLGARASFEVSPHPSSATARVLVFGDSFAAGSGLPQSLIWTEELNHNAKRFEAVNFGVDGYSMGQAFLRYQDVGSKIAHDIVLLMFVPSADLWRDINVLRELGEPGWDFYRVQPRFTLRGSKLHLVPSPFPMDRDLSADMSREQQDLLIAHLREYDRFYFRPKYEMPPWLGHLITYKLLARAYYEYAFNKQHMNVYHFDSEAVRVSGAIFQTMCAQVVAAGQRFLLVLLPVPDDLSRMEEEPQFRITWTEMSKTLCTGVDCLDMTTSLRNMSTDELDFALDGSHYGPKANRWLAHFVLAELEARFSGK